MKKQLKKHIHSIFMPYQYGIDTLELEEELYQNLSDKFKDYKDKGYSVEDAYKSTVNSIGDVAELMESIEPQFNKPKEDDGVFSSIKPGVLGSFSNGVMAAAVYAMLFVALMIAFNGTISRDGITLPALTLFAVISLVQYLVKGNSQNPRWLVLGSFFTSVVAAGIMTAILH